MAAIGDAAQRSGPPGPPKTYLTVPGASMSSKARSPGPSRPSVRGPTQVLLIVGSQVLGATGVEGTGHEGFQAGSSVHAPEAGSKPVSSSTGPQVLASFPPT